MAVRGSYCPHAAVNYLGRGNLQNHDARFLVAIQSGGLDESKLKQVNEAERLSRHTTSFSDLPSNPPPHVQTKWQHKSTSASPLHPHLAFQALHPPTLAPP